MWRGGVIQGSFNADEEYIHTCSSRAPDVLQVAEPQESGFPSTPLFKSQGLSSVVSSPECCSRATWVVTYPHDLPLVRLPFLAKCFFIVATRYF